MKTLVLYASRYGFTEKCASIMVRHRVNVHLYHIEDKEYNLNDYDEIIIGSPIYAGKINKHVSKLMKDHQDLLVSKTLRFFLCGMNPENEQEVISLNFNDVISNHAKIKYIGGAFQFEKMNWFFKKLVKKIAKTEEDKEILLKSNIEYVLN